MLARMPLNGRIYHFGFFMMPLATLWLMHLLVFETAQPAQRALRVNHLLPVAFSIVALAGVTSLLGTSLHRYARKNYVVGTGRDHFYTFGPDVFSNGQMVAVFTELFKERTPTAHSLVVFPEGIAVNYQLRIPSTLAEMDFQPVALAYAGPSHVLDELKAHPPEAIFLFDRDYSEFAEPYFGADEVSGRSLVAWINDHYWEAGYMGQTNKTASHHVIDILKLRTPDSQGVELLHEAGQPVPSGSP
jgi:hypothetical protein